MATFSSTPLLAFLNICFNQVKRYNNRRKSINKNTQMNTGNRMVLIFSISDAVDVCDFVFS